MPAGNLSEVDAMDELLVEARGLTKSHRLWRRPSDRLISGVLSSVADWTVLPAALRARLNRSVEHRGPAFHALRDVGFTLKRGESLGIIGRNGSGKSTLLQILAGTLTPTSGEVTVRGQVAALLELGSGFNPEFSGRENVLILAALFGLSRREALARFPQVASFAGIGDFIEQPVKVYSTGMLVRLAFATQTVLNPELFIVDEALAVGDVFFQARCARFFQEKIAGGMSLILVSHDLPSVKALCGKTIVLHEGRVAFYGASEEAVNVYHHLHRAGVASDEEPATAPPPQTEAAVRLPDSAVERNWDSTDEVGSREAEIVHVRLLNAAGAPAREFQLGETLVVECYVRSRRNLSNIQLGLEIVDRHNRVVYGVSSVHLNLPPQTLANGRLHCFDIAIKTQMGAGDYLVDLAIGWGDRGDGAPEQLLHRVDKIAAFSVRHAGPRPAFFGPADLQARIALR